MFCGVYIGFFFFKQKTAYEMRSSDWSSDVCSSDLLRYSASTVRAWMVSAHRSPSVAGSNMGVPLRIISKTTGNVDSESRGRRRWALGTGERRPGPRPELEPLRCPMLLHRPRRKSLWHYHISVSSQVRRMGTARVET